MFEALRSLVLRWARTPAEPEPPAGDPGSIRVFRAGPAYFKYKLVGWGLGQLGALAALAVSLVVGIGFVGDWLGSGVAGAVLTALVGLAWLGILVQIPLTYAALRLDFEMRWYMLSDRSLRIREGVFTVREKTMTFANIQQISVKQGPLQRLLGIADIEVRTAGGGSAPEGGGGMHQGYFRGVEDAESIRDTIHDRVRRYRAAGLGDPTPRATASRPDGAQDGAPDGTLDDALDAAHEVLGAARALRSALGA